MAPISDGGSIAVQSEIPKPASGNRADSMVSDQVLAKLLLSEARERRHVIVVLPVSRSWGFVGHAEFHLFLDANDRLVGYYLLHVN
jgi:hypothetical protein